MKVTLGALLLMSGAAFACCGGSIEPWTQDALFTAPKVFAVEEACSNACGRIEGVRPIWIEGLPYRSKPTRIFAWVGLPKGASASNRAPAMVLVHGGGGTAFATWVKLWNDRGYAAIAMDTCGSIPKGESGSRHPRHAWSGPEGWHNSFHHCDGPLADQWTYHAVAAVTRCHTYLRSLPEVDSAHVGLTGISWGGYLTSIVMGLDNRFRFAAPVYGCGFYEMNHEWTQISPNVALDGRWSKPWDPKNYIGRTTMPVLWCDGTNDKWYPLDMLANSVGLLDARTPLALSIKYKMPHGHPPSGDPKEITAFAGHFLKGEPAPAEVKSARFEDGRLFVEFAANGDRVVAAELFYTVGREPVLREREWKVEPVPGFDAACGKFSAQVPGTAVMFFGNIKTESGLAFSTRIFAPTVMSKEK